MEIISREDFMARVKIAAESGDKDAIGALTDMYLKSLEVKDSAKTTTKPKAESKTHQARKSGKRVIQIGKVCGTSLDKIGKKLEKIIKKSDEAYRKPIETPTKKEKQSFELESGVANDLISKYCVKSNDFTMKRYYIINRISYRLHIANPIKINTVKCELNLKAGNYEIESYMDKDGNHKVLKGFF